MSSISSDFSMGAVQHSFKPAPLDSTKVKKNKSLKLQRTLKLKRKTPQANEEKPSLPKQLRQQIEKSKGWLGFGSVVLPGAFVSLGGGTSPVTNKEFKARAGIGLHIGFLPLFRAVTANVGLHAIFDRRSRPDFQSAQRTIRTAQGIQPSITLSYLEVNFPILFRKSDPYFIKDPVTTKGLGFCAALPLTYGLLSFCAEHPTLLGQQNPNTKSPLQQDQWSFSARIGW